MWERLFIIFLVEHYILQEELYCYILLAAMELKIIERLHIFGSNMEDTASIPRRIEGRRFSADFDTKQYGDWVKTGEEENDDSSTKVN